MLGGSGPVVGSDDDHGPLDHVGVLFGVAYKVADGALAPGDPRKGFSATHLWCRIWNDLLACEEDRSSFQDLLLECRRSANSPFEGRVAHRYGPPLS